MINIVDLTSDPAFELDAELRVIAWNRRAEDLFGLAREFAVGRRCYEALNASLPDGGPLCGPDCHGGLCFREGLPFGVGECIVATGGAMPVRVALSSLVLPREAAAPEPRHRVLVLIHPLDRDGAGVTMPQPFRIHLLGRFTITRNERHVPLATWHRKASLTLLKLLAMRRGQSVHRDILIERLWPDAEPRQGRERLKVAVCYARHELGSRTLIQYADDGYVLAGGEFWLDVAAYEAHIAAGVRDLHSGRVDRAIDEFRDALELYRGDLLEEDLYDDWCADERERQRELFFTLAEQLAAALRHRNRLDEAEQICRRALAREDCREVFHRMLMQILIGMGHLDRAELQYHRCRAILRREFDVEPLPETRRVLDLVRAARSARP